MAAYSAAYDPEIVLLYLPEDDEELDVDPPPDATAAIPPTTPAIAPADIPPADAATLVVDVVEDAVEDVD